MAGELHSSAGRKDYQGINGVNRLERRPRFLGGCGDSSAPRRGTLGRRAKRFNSKGRVAAIDNCWSRVRRPRPPAERGSRMSSFRHPSAVRTWFWCGYIALARARLHSTTASTENHPAERALIAPAPPRGILPKTRSSFSSRSTRRGAGGPDAVTIRERRALPRAHRVRDDSVASRGRRRRAHARPALSLAALFRVAPLRALWTEHG